MKRWLFAILGVVILITVALLFIQSKGGKEQALPEKVSYNFHIRPILSDKCFKCHGPDATHREAHFRLDITDSAFAPLKNTKGAFAFVPGHPEESEVYKRISTEDLTYRMPTPESHLTALSEYEVKLFRKWIKQGAKYEPHWAFVAPVKSAIPEAADKNWPRNEIDRFILSKMNEKGLFPNEEADKERLLKRVYLDLTGLPPTIEKMDGFLTDNDPDAYEKLWMNCCKPHNTAKRWASLDGRGPVCR